MERLAAPPALVELALRLCGLVRPAFHGVTARLPTWRAICVVACEKKRVTQLNPKSRNGTLGQRDRCLDRCLRCGSDNASISSRCDTCLLPLQHLKHGLRGSQLGTEWKARLRAAGRRLGSDRIAVAGSAVGCPAAAVEVSYKLVCS